MRKQRIDTIRLKLLKIAARMVKSARYKYFKLCSSCPYKKEFYETLENIRNLQPQLEWQLLTNLDNHNKLLNLSQEKSAHFQAIFWQGEVLRVVVTATTADVMHTYAAVNNSGLEHFILNTNRTLCSDYTKYGEWNA